MLISLNCNMQYNFKFWTTALLHPTTAILLPLLAPSSLLLCTLLLVRTSCSALFLFACTARTSCSIARSPFAYPFMILLETHHTRSGKKPSVHLFIDFPYPLRDLRLPLTDFVGTFAYPLCFDRNQKPTFLVAPLW
jgi:hypothetical protein